MKVKHHWTDASVDANLLYWKDVLPEKNTCPKSLDDAKKIVCPLDLPIEEIWELNYSGEIVPMFRVRWAKSVTPEDRYFITMSIPKAKSSANVTAQNEPWVLAKHCTQCFFIIDSSKPIRVVVRRGKRNIIGIDGVANEDYNQYGDPMREDDDDDEAYVKRRSKTTLPKKDRNPWKRKSR